MLLYDLSVFITVTLYAVFSMVSSQPENVSLVVRCLLQHQFTVVVGSGLLCFKFWSPVREHRVCLIEWPSVSEAAVNGDQNGRHLLWFAFFYTAERGVTAARVVVNCCQSSTRYVMMSC